MCAALPLTVCPTSSTTYCTTASLILKMRRSIESMDAFIDRSREEVIDSWDILKRTRDAGFHAAHPEA